MMKKLTKFAACVTDSRAKLAQSKGRWKWNSAERIFGNFSCNPTA
jgi:hypothetical protein